MNNSTNSLEERVQERFMQVLREQLSGLRDKVDGDFSKISYDEELSDLKSDSVYSNFKLARPEYVLIRLMGRISISIGRRLGQIYDQIPRFVAAARFGLSPEVVSTKIEGLELDLAVPFSYLDDEDESHVKGVLDEYHGLEHATSGVGIEIRYNFNPNDSARLRKDKKMANNLISNGMQPVYLVFSSISPRDEAISSLTRAGWDFLIGDDAVSFSKDMFGTEISDILNKDKVEKEIKDEMDDILEELYSSYAFEEVKRHIGNIS